MRTQLNRRHFLRGTGKLIEYGLGPLIGFTDENPANKILVASKNNQYAVSEFNHALIQSQPFQSK